MKVDVWRAIFNNYQDLSIGTLYHKDKGPLGYSNMVADFELVNKMHLDMALRRIESLKEAMTYVDEYFDMYESKPEAKELIKKVIKLSLKKDDEAAK